MLTLTEKVNYKLTTNKKNEFTHDLRDVIIRHVYQARMRAFVLNTEEEGS